MRQRAHALLNDVPAECLPDLIKTLEAFASRPASNLSEPEIELIEIINRRLPTMERERFDDLRDKNEWGTLTDAEHQELLGYVDVIEEMDVVRVDAMMKLAKLRQVSFDAVLSEFAPDRDVHDVHDEEE
jgi:hypothetical protein